MSVKFKNENLIVPHKEELQKRFDVIMRHLELKSGAELKSKKDEAHIAIGLANDLLYSRIESYSFELAVDDMITALKKLSSLN